MFSMVITVWKCPEGIILTFEIRLGLWRSTKINIKIIIVILGRGRWITRQKEQIFLRICMRSVYSLL